LLLSTIFARKDTRLQARIDRIRRFERFYEEYVRHGDRGEVRDDFSATDLRVLHELGLGGEGGSGAWLSYRLDLDPGHVCRALKKLEAWTLVTSRPHRHDRRMRSWDLTPLGRSFADGIEARHRERIRDGLLGMLPREQQRLVRAMRVVEEILTYAARSSCGGPSTGRLISCRHLW
jgi:DNA-binding MarR family transcriptional regulator